MDRKKYEEAKKKLVKPKEPFMLIQVRYGGFVLPWSLGVKFMEVIQQAEEFNTYQKTEHFKDMSKDTITVNPMSVRDYEDYKVSQLFKVPIDQLKELLETEEEKQT